MAPYLRACFIMTVMLTFVCVRSHDLHMKSQVVDAFLAKFQLKQDEVKVLRGTKDGSLHPVSVRGRRISLQSHKNVYYVIFFIYNHLPPKTWCITFEKLYIYQKKNLYELRYCRLRSFDGATVSLYYFL